MTNFGKFYLLLITVIIIGIVGALAYPWYNQYKQVIDKQTEIKIQKIQTKDNNE
jgi:Tfp pilus assembly protein PilE